MSTRDTCQGLTREAAVTAQDGKCHVLAINTTEQDMELSVRPQEIIPFDFCKFPGEEFSDSETEDLQKYPQDKLGAEYSDRARKVIQSLHVSHLTPEEKDYVYPMDTVLKGMHGTEVFVYLGDIVVYAESLDEHDKKARRLFDRRWDANLKL